MRTVVSQSILAIGMIFLCSNAASLEFGRIGHSYKKEGSKWHDVQIKDESFCVKCSIPGSPKSKMENGWVTFNSFYNNSHYSCTASLPIIKYVVPENEDEMKRLYDYDKLGGKLEKFSTNKKNVKYAAQADFLTKEGFHGRMRIYTTENNIYILTVVGYDLSLSDKFFDTLEINQ